VAALRAARGAAGNSDNARPTSTATSIFSEKAAAMPKKTGSNRKRSVREPIV
jgi:hypothetical protein